MNLDEAGRHRACLIKMIGIAWIGAVILQAGALTVRQVLVPGYSVKGQNVTLECDFDLGGDTLYSLKWYKGFSEFFRYVPGDKPQIQVFDVPGVSVDMSKSGISRVVLKEVSRDSSGKYKCEASAEAPSFHTDSGEGELLVVVLPKHPPQITGLQPKYYLGDTIHLNCTTTGSKPAASLSWYINDAKADPTYLRDYAPVTDSDGSEMSTLGLTFVAKPKHLSSREVTFRCTATIASVFFRERTVRAKGRLVPRQTAFPGKGLLTGSAPPTELPHVLLLLAILVR